MVGPLYLNRNCTSERKRANADSSERQRVDPNQTREERPDAEEQSLTAKFPDNSSVTQSRCVSAVALYSDQTERCCANSHPSRETSATSDRDKRRRTMRRELERSAGSCVTTQRAPERVLQLCLCRYRQITGQGLSL